MKKFIMLSAVMAVVSTAFVACSSDDDLAQAPVVPEESVSEGTPLVVKFVDATRGTDYSNTNLPGKFTLFATAKGGTTRWPGALGARTTSTSSNGTAFNNDGSGNFAPASTINWQDGAWDFYAVSDATFPEVTVESVDQDGEFLADASRHFYYKVPTIYSGTGAQTDLLVGAALGKDKSGGDVTLQFYHALAQIGSITFTFSDLDADNTAFTYIIKSATLCNVNSQGKYTFPAVWDADHYNAWSNLDLPAEYEIEFPDFEKDDQGYYKIFDLSDDNTVSPSSREATDFATGTNRGETGIPNYFSCPAAHGTWSYTLPLAKKNATAFSIDTDENATHPTFTQDGGLYVLPQSLTKTVWEKNSNDEITGVESGVYLKVKGIILNRNTPGNDFHYSFDNYTHGFTGVLDWQWANNFYVTEILNSYGGSNEVGTYYIPLVKATKAMKAGHLYNLTFDLSKAVTTESGDQVFAGATIE